MTTACCLTKPFKSYEYYNYHCCRRHHCCCCCYIIIVVVVIITIIVIVVERDLPPAKHSRILLLEPLYPVGRFLSPSHTAWRDTDHGDPPCTTDTPGTQNNRVLDQRVHWYLLCSYVNIVMKCNEWCFRLCFCSVRLY